MIASATTVGTYRPTFQSDESSRNNLGSMLLIKMTQILKEMRACERCCDFTWCRVALSKIISGKYAPLLSLILQEQIKYLLQETKQNTFFVFPLCGLLLLVLKWSTNQKSHLHACPSSGRRCPLAGIDFTEQCSVLDRG